MASGAVDHVERAGVRELMCLGDLPRIGVVDVFLHRMHGHGHHVGALFTGGLGLGDGTVDVGLMLGVAGFAQAVDLPVMVGGHAVERHRAGDQAELAAARGRVDDQRLGGVLLGLVRTGLRDALGRERIPQAGDAVGTLIP